MLWDNYWDVWDRFKQVIVYSQHDSDEKIKRGYIKGIIGLPTNHFYDTGIPACIIVLDKENAQNRTGLFMIDARNDKDKVTKASVQKRIKEIMGDADYADKQEVLEKEIKTEVERISQRLAQRIKELSERYENKLSDISGKITEYETKVREYLVKRGFNFSL